MLAAAGALLLALSPVVFYFRIRRGIYRRYPYEQFLLVGAAAVFGLMAAVSNPGAVTLILFGVELLALGLVIRFLAIGRRFPREEITVKAGERFPEFALPDSEGGTFDSRSLLGSSAALYISYRGHL